MAQGESEAIAISQVMVVVGSVGFAGIQELSALLPQVIDLRVTINVLSFSGEIYALKQLAKHTNGSYHVPISTQDLKTALNSLIALKPTNDAPATLLPIALPLRKFEIDLGICATCGQVHQVFYQCPQCAARVCRTGQKCPVCGIHIITSVQIAKAARKIMVKLFPTNNNNKQINCFICGDQCEIASLCPDCSNSFCMYKLNCNVYIHETLLMCPGCM